MAAACLCDKYRILCTLHEKKREHTHTSTPSQTKETKSFLVAWQLVFFCLVFILFYSVAILSDGSLIIQTFSCFCFFYFSTSLEPEDEPGLGDQSIFDMLAHLVDEDENSSGNLFFNIQLPTMIDFALQLKNLKPIKGLHFSLQQQSNYIIIIISFFFLSSSSIYTLQTPTYTTHTQHRYND